MAAQLLLDVKLIPAGLFVRLPLSVAAQDRFAGNII